MNILHILTTGGLYGKERMVLTNVKMLDDLGESTNTLVIQGPGGPIVHEEAQRLGIESMIFNKFKQLIGIIRDRNFDLIHVHDYKDSILLGAFQILGHNDTPILRTFHGFTSKGKPLFHRGRLYEVLDKLFCRSHACLIGVSKELGQALGIPYILNGITTDDDPNFKPRRDIASICADPSIFTICCISRLSAEKNVLNLIWSLSEVPNHIHLVLFGEGNQSNQVNSLVESLGLKNRVILGGYDVQAKRYLPLMDAYIQPSLSEGTPIAVLEAMSCNIPLIVSNVGGMKPLVHDKAALECGTSPHLIASSISTLSAQPERAQKLAIIARRLFDYNFSARSMSEKYLSHYKRLVHE